jgi:high-affinity Fe2+/Pb2+ permease
MYTAFPAFIAEGVVLAVFSRLGLNEITLFISSMPLLVAAWFFLVGYWIDRLRIRKLKTKSMRTL